MLQLRVLLRIVVVQVASMSPTKKASDSRRSGSIVPFWLATEVASGLASFPPTTMKESTKNGRAQQEWGRSFWALFPRYEIKNGDEAFQVALDVPGVKLSDMELSRRMQVLTVYDQREIGNASRTAISSRSVSRSTPRSKTALIRKKFKRCNSIPLARETTTKRKNLILLKPKAGRELS
jgi:HSP20 family molecular chaperone IbpA